MCGNAGGLLRSKITVHRRFLHAGGQGAGVGATEGGGYIHAPAPGAYSEVVNFCQTG